MPQPAADPSKDYVEWTDTGLARDEAYDYEFRSVGSGQYQTSDPASIQIETRAVATVPRTWFSYTITGRVVRLSYTAHANRPDLRYTFYSRFNHRGVWWNDFSAGGTFSGSQTNILITIPPTAGYSIVLRTHFADRLNEPFAETTRVISSLPTRPTAPAGKKALPDPEISITSASARGYSGFLVSWPLRTPTSQYETRFRFIVDRSYTGSLLSAGENSRRYLFVKSFFTDQRTVEVGVREIAPRGSTTLVNSGWSTRNLILGRDV